MKTLFKGIVGSTAFGTNGPQSDTDIAEIFMCDNEDLLGFTYKEHDDIDKDNRRYELNKFVKLLMKGNANMLEILNLPDNCVLQTSPEWEYIKSFKNTFVTKQLYGSFVEYANTQIVKAKGLNKKANWEEKKITRKTVLDVCYVLVNGKSYPLKEFLEKNNMKQEQCGLVKVNHMRDVYSLYFDSLNEYGFKGIVKDEQKNNDVVLSSIPKEVQVRGTLFFNKDAYQIACKEYKEYQTWLTKRNDVRYNTNKKHGQKYDSKNIMHVVRLLKTARDIAENGIVKVRRDEDEIKYLLRIKAGEENLEALIEWAATETKNLKELFEKSNLREEVDKDFCHNLVVGIRTGKI